MSPDCLATGRDETEMRVSFHYEGRAHAPERSFTVASDAVRMEDGCYTLALAPNPKGLTAMTVKLVGPDGEPLWNERVDLSALKPMR